MNGSIARRGRVLAPLAVGVTLLTAGCGGSGGSPSTNGSSDHQKLVAFAECMRSHGVPDWPDPLPQGGFPRAGADQTPQFGSALKACQHLLPPRQPPTTAQEHQMLAQDLQYARCMRSHGFPGWPDPSALPGGGVAFAPPAGFDPTSPRALAAQNTCQNGAFPKGPPQGG